MTRFTSLVTRSLVALLIAGGALTMNAQEPNDAITVAVPFAFTAGGEGFTPGTYRFSLLSSQFLLSVTNVKTNDTEMFDVRPERQRTLEQHGRLVFRDSADRGVLDEVHFPGTDLFSQVLHRRPGKIRNMQASATGSPCPARP